MKRRKVNKKSAAAKQVPTQCATIQKKSPCCYCCYENLSLEVMTLQLQTSPSPVVALANSASSTNQLSPVSSCDGPSVLKCLDVTYESQEQGPGVSYKTGDEKEWTPVVGRKRKPRERRHESSDSDSDSDGSEVDVSCSRLVRYVERRDQTPGLTVFRGGPATWILIKAAILEPIAARTVIL